MMKAQRMIGENLKLVDAVCELLDARIPNASRNPDIDRIAGQKPRLVILNRADLADPVMTGRWVGYYKGKGLAVLETDAKSGRGVNGFVPAVRELLKEKLEINAAKGQTGKPLRIMILGIPNVGKSTFINKVARRKAAVAGDKPGVTRGDSGSVLTAVLICWIHRAFYGPSLIPRRWVSCWLSPTPSSRMCWIRRL